MARSRIDVRKLAEVVAIALGAMGVGWGIASVEAEHVHHAAVDLLDGGRRMTVRDVEVHVDTWRGTTSVDGVRVVFPVHGRPVATELVGGGEPVDDEYPEDGWQTPAAGSFYTPPLDVLVLPDDIEVAMAVEDVELYRTSTLGADLAISGGLVAGAGVSLLIRRGLPPAGRGTHGRHRA